MRTDSPEMAPRTSAPSPTVIVRLTTSPSMLPSIWMSPLQIRSPLIFRSGLMIDGAAARAARPGSDAADGVGVGAGVEVVLLSFENILACLHEVHGIVGFPVHPHLVVHMRPRGTAGVAERPDLLPETHGVADLHRDRLQMCIPRVNAETMVDLDDSSIIAHPPRIDNCSRCRAQHPGADLILEIEALMHRAPPVHGIVALAEAAFDGEAGERRRQRQAAQHELQPLPPLDLAVEILDAG